jgi:hypothetical protein
MDFIHREGRKSSHHQKLVKKDSWIQDPRPMPKTKVSLHMYLTSLSYLASMGDCARILGGGCHILGGGIEFPRVRRGRGGRRA